MKLSTAFFILLLTLLQYRLWVGNGSMTEVYQLQSQIEQIQQKNENLKERNLTLAAEVIDLKEGQGAIEEIARSEMGMIKQNETFYQIIDYSAVQSTKK